MTDLNERPHRKLFSARRLTLLGSAAVLGSAIVLSGPLGYGRFAGNAFAAMPVSQTQQGPNGFADLVSKVKPAVISVRVKLDESAGGIDADAPQMGRRRTAAVLQRTRRSKNSSASSARTTGPQMPPP